jgi:PI-3-kinase-related kinase SMG-1
MSWKQLPARLLLQFVDHLEKQIYLACEGTMHQLSQQALKNSSLFFRANRKVCDDWFSRMRQLLVLASVGCNSAHDIVRHTTQVCSTKAMF